MVIRVHPSMTVLYETYQVTPEELKGLTGTAATRLYRYVADLELTVCGPVYWFYYGTNGRAGGRYTLEVALPVQGRIPTALLPFFKKVPSFRCLSARYEGGPEGLAAHYREMADHATEKELKMNGIYAEAFLHIDPEATEALQVEVMVGLS